MTTQPARTLPATNIARTAAVLITLLSFLVSLTPRVPARPLPDPEKPADMIATPTTEVSSMQAREAYGKLPLSFEPNQGQADEQVKYLSRGQGYTIFLTAMEAVFALRGADSRASADKRGAGQVAASAASDKRMHSRDHNARTAMLRMKLVGAKSDAQVTGEESLEGKVNYLTGNDQTKWRTNIPTHRQVRYREVWPGIDMLWYGQQQEVEYDFVLKPGADPNQIKLAFDGADQLRLDDAGNLLTQTKAGEVVQRAPVIYQDGPHGRASVSGKYVVRSQHDVGFEIGAYDRSLPLVIDPQLVYSTYLGSNSLDAAFGIAVNSSGQAFVTGETDLPSNFPRDNEVGLQNPNTVVAFVTKLNANGTDTIYSTLIGNGSYNGGPVVANAIALTSDGKAAITGSVENSLGHSEFPITANAYQDGGRGCLGVCQGRDRLLDAFVTVLNSQGNGLFYSTYFGGSSFSHSFAEGDSGEAIAVDSANHVYITGSTFSNNLPTRNAFQSSRQSSGDGLDAFVAVFNPAAAKGDDTLLYASFLGGEGDDLGKGIAVDAAHNAYVVGSTASIDLQTKSPSGQALPPLRAGFQGGATDGFIAKIDTESSGASSLTYLTYFGGNINDRVESVAVDSLQRAYITGASNSSASSFPLLNAFDSTQFNDEAFVAKLNADGTALFYSSFLGGNNSEEGLGIAIDATGNAYLTGRTTSGASFPVGAIAPPFPANLQGTAFVAKIEAKVTTTGAAKLLYSSTFGGFGTRAEAIAIDPRGNVYLAGSSTGNLPTTPGAFQTTFGGGASDGFVAKVGSTFADTIGVFRQSSGQFLLRNSNTAGQPDITLGFGQPGDQPLAGDWTGDGIDDVGVFRPSTGQFIFHQLLIVPGFPPHIITSITVNFGQAGDLAVVGDWIGTGVDTPGVFRPSTGQWLLTTVQNINNSSPPANITFNLGQAGDTPLAGDWNGDGIDTPGVFRPSVATFSLSNNFNGTIDIAPFVFGSLVSVPLTGDWNGDGVDTIGIFNSNPGAIGLNNTNTSGNGIGDLVFSFGQSGDLPVAGEWDGKP